ncbi:glycosyltransferase family 2 protein [Leptospira sp. 'Mane']|uniref:glycosyltransferase family 2 protein n=1 Tax=Leptospira sp. 'Mane' TaxID=3387407 RepID=UPI00398AF253
MSSLSIVIPCYNEAEGLKQLENRLNLATKKIPSNFSYEIILVDDGSTDNTLAVMKELFSSNKKFRIVAHEKNLNLGAAIRTGISQSNSEYVIFLDSDCTYDPEYIIPILDELVKGIDLVTLSPYHPKGEVLGVPPRRLFLSKSLSTIYQIILGKEIYTYTAMVRGYNRKILKEIISEKNDFSAVAEMLLKAILKGYSISEIPAVLSVRKYGQSKMKVLKVIREHLKLVFRLLVMRKSFN